MPYRLASVNFAVLSAFYAFSFILLLFALSIPTAITCFPMASVCIPVTHVEVLLCSTSAKLIAPMNVSLVSFCRSGHVLTQIRLTPML